MKARATSNSFGVWTAMLLPPIIWAMQMQANYVLVRYECTIGHKLTMISIDCLSLAIISIGFVLALLNLVVPSANLSEREKVREHFMAQMGLFSSAIFFLVTLAQGIAVLVFHPCQL
jgi:hypothetical protein